MTIIIYLIGKPGTGKYTIAKEIAQHGYIVCDNQLINNPIFALLNHDGLTRIPMFAWNSIEKIRDSIFDFISIEPCNNYVLTNVLYEETGDQQLFKKVEELALKRNSLFIPIKLQISEQEHLKRIQNPDRKFRYKTINADEVYIDLSLIEITHPNAMELDVSDVSANYAAVQILAHVKNRLLAQ